MPDNTKTLDDRYAGLVEDAARGLAVATGSIYTDENRELARRALEAACVRGLLTTLDDTRGLLQATERSRKAEQAWCRDVMDIVNAAYKWRHSTGGDGSGGDLIRAVDRVYPRDED